MTYIPTTSEQRTDMLQTCGVSSIDELFADIPNELSPQNNDNFWATEGMSEFEVLKECGALAGQNRADLVSFLGGGFYDHFIPAAIDAIVSRSEFYTAYTPYQPELSQGTLQAIYEYQSQICRLTGMEISNASLYDGGTAIFEACKMALSSLSSKNKIVVDKGVNPIYRDMLRAHTAGLCVDIAEVPICSNNCMDRGGINAVIDENTAAVVLQNPNFLGVIDDYSDVVNTCKDKGVVSILSTYPISLALIKSPAEQGFDIAVGEGQSLGIPLSFGGPYLGFIAAKKELARKMPGRIAARTVDVNGRDGFVLSLQAREQHIRREKATSNICSNSALCALRAHVYLSLMGKGGLTEVASLCHNKAMYLRERVQSSIPSIKIAADQPIFNEFVVSLPISANQCVDLMTDRGFAAGIPVDSFGELFCDGIDTKNMLLIAVTEKRTKVEIDSFVDNLKDVLC